MAKLKNEVWQISTDPTGEFEGQTDIAFGTTNSNKPAIRIGDHVFDGTGGGGGGGGATNLENGSAYDSLKQIDLPYNELVAAIVAGSSYSELEVRTALAAYGIVSDTHNHIYGAGSTTVGIENTTGVQGDNSKGIASFNSGIGNKITGNGCSGNIGGTKNENGGSLSVIAGGTENTIGNENGRNGIIGGEYNELDANDAFIGGGIYNEIWEKASAILGGRYNKIGDAENANVKARYAVITGGNTNKISNEGGDAEDADFAFIGGGQGNIINNYKNVGMLGGFGLRARWGNQAIVGCCNELSKALFIVGDGTSDAARKNAFEVLGHDVLGAGNVGIKVGNTQLTETKLQEIISGGSGGGSLYFHKIRISDDSGGTFTFSVITSKEDAYENSYELASIYNIILDQVGVYYDADERRTGIAYIAGIDFDTQDFILYTSDGSSVYWVYPVVSDTVIEL